MFRHPIPLNTLCHHQANIAYDKLAVISDHIDELANVADCILDLKEYLFHILKLYVTLAKDETIPGKKKFTKPITTTKVNLYNEVDESDNIAFIETGWDDCAPYVDLHVDREDSQTHDQYKANIRLLLDPCDNYKAKFLIPYTDGEEDYSAVCVKYLEERWQILKDLIDNLTDRMSAVEGAIVGLGGHLNSALNYPADNSNELVTSDGIYEYGQTIKQELLDAINLALGSVSDTNTTYSFTLDGNNLIITPSSGNVQTIDLSLLNPGSGSNDSYIFAYPSGTVDNQMPTPEEINAWDIVTGDRLASAVEVSVYSTENHPDIITYTIDQNSSLNSNSFTASGYHGDETVYNPTNLASSDRYRCIVAPVVSQGTVSVGNTRPTVTVKAGVFQQILGG